MMEENTTLLVDTHCHLNFSVFDSDRQQVLQAARQSGVHKFIVPAVDIESSHKIVALAQQTPGVFAAIGVHPNDGASCWSAQAYSRLGELAHQPKVLAIGEIGLDYYRDRTERTLQRKVFEQQLILAAELGLPVIIHNREATVDTLAILDNWLGGLRSAGNPLASRPGVLHSFSGSLEDANRVCGYGFWVGITGVVTFKNARLLHEVVVNLSLDRLLIETDAPFLTPHPYRGQRNEPARVRLVAEKIAQLRNLSFEDVAGQTFANAEQLFLWRNTN